MNKIDSQKVLYSAGKNDECFTPRYAVLPILKYLPREWTIWCPFDTSESEYARVLQENGYKVICSHIDMGHDFFAYEPAEHWDCIVSNPPFSNKRKIFERALSFGRPFALLMSNTWLNDSAPKQVLGNNMELLMFEERIKFLNHGIVQSKITFSSSYFCYKLLPRPILCESLKQYMKRSKEND